MPINYQAPQGAGSAYMHAASNFSPGAAADLIGREEALGQQQTLQNQRLLFEGGQQANLESARLQAAAAAQERHAQLQVWVNGQEMTQAEQMQLRQDQNAIAWINSQRDKTLTGQEADDAIAQRMARVNLGQQRLQAMELKHKSQLISNEQINGQIAAAHYQQIKDSQDSRIVTVINPDFEDAANRFVRDTGGDPSTPEGKKKAEGYAASLGHARTGTPQPNGVIKLIRLRRSGLEKVRPGQEAVPICRTTPT